MAEHTYEQLKGMTVADLRKLADELKNEALEGHNTMHKEQLLPLLCKVLGIHTHHAAEGAEKTKIKMTIHKLRAQRDKALAERNAKELPRLHHQIHVLKHKLRRMARQKA